LAAQDYTAPETALFTTQENYLTESSTSSFTTGGMTTGALGTGDQVDAADTQK
jgi:hypothetical protein